MYRSHRKHEGLVIIMKIILKLFVAPFALLFTAAAFFFTFLLSASEKLFSIASGIVFLGTAVLLAMGEVIGGIAFIVLAFLVSPYGLYACAGWLTKMLGNASGALRGFIFS